MSVFEKTENSTSAMSAECDLNLHANNIHGLIVNRHIYLTNMEGNN